ncbi:LuxR C-terminal-related transcriptional regulator [Nocardioides sp. WV_118_6]|uniref:LuxR C-terminal-related transcriptional regulator n=1 Tax=Nocardioides simplex TaxID=2045 RepID=UPI00214F73F4|nr:LuxR C-terminal-related transcriptional regulator [Pimelobacter simplex]UUW90699.1 LuxR C-terminal-related transcriptional regulator [Pimelobacter simplex]UUW94528.1 LuxR C-terminal-related transcriptional regulator [Pimelobacter simplex]
MSLGATYVAATTRLPLLDRRERQVLQLVALGRSRDQIAAQLYLDPVAVEELCTRIFATLELTPTPHLDRRVLAVLTLGQSAP